MITLFENYISQFNHRHNADILDDVGLSEDQYEQIIDKVASWYYDEYHITFLGSGSYGSAFRINNTDNRVLKITTDHNEAANISYLVKKVNVKGIVEYHDIHKVRVYVDGEIVATVYSVIMEKLYDISDMESTVYRLLFNEYFKNKGGIIDLYNYLSKLRINCTWEEFKKLNPNKVNIFISKHKAEVSKYDIKEVKRLANIYYEDIMGLVSSVLKYNLSLTDVHSGNIRKTDDEHMKVIDVGCDTTKSFKSKCATIDIEIDERDDNVNDDDYETYEEDEYYIYYSEDNEIFKKYNNNSFDSNYRAEEYLLDEILNKKLRDVQTFNKKIDYEYYQIYQSDDIYYLITMDDRRIIKNSDPNQLKLDLISKSGNAI